MNVSHADQLNLLELQELDMKESALRHRRNAHPAHEKVRELAGRAEDLQRASVAQSAVISDLGRELTRIEDEITKVQDRRERQRGRIERNEVPLRDISSMEHEIAQMDARLTSLENNQLGVEERIEEAKKAKDAMTTEAQAIRDDVEATKKSFAEDTAELDDELRGVIATRRELAAALGEAILGEYEHARSRNGVLAVLEVRDGVGIGMAADLSPLELDELRRTPDDELYWTSDTSQIVVRTTASERN
ncbi:hypothetical protein G7Y41_04255 [Schaalia sp. ZJ405]|uniref:zinc ribbon domain-containing protein n=1 Tax=unclassified Schaalia TaxID=2691889 RepID=UPI0013EAB822|nr:MULTISPECIES: hypothetical protein [unclassified Schaalia]QPK82021.1 hypothetical protein G7Y41_04255 [Schaalia sp. ZJ405]